MSDQFHQAEPKCAQCGITERQHRDLYDTPLGQLQFTFQPDQGPRAAGTIHLCRPCSHEVLSERLLRAAGVTEAPLVAETWK